MATGTRPRPGVEVRDDASTGVAGVARDRRPTAAALSAASAARSAVLAVVGWAAAVPATGLLAVATSSRIGAPPFAGRWRLVAPWPAGAVIAAAVAAAVIALATRTTYVARVRWRWLLAGSMLGALAWSVSLALVDGPSGLAGSLGGRYDYLAAVADAGSPDGFLARFVPGHDSWPIHVQGHPPGMVLLLLGLDAVGLARTGVVAALVLVGGSAAVPAVLVATRDVAGDAAARRLAPALVLAPAAIWWSSADASTPSARPARRASERRGPTWCASWTATAPWTRAICRPWSRRWPPGCSICVSGPGAPPPAPGPVTARAANRVLAEVVRRRHGVRLHDLGPMRAARREALAGLGLRDRRFGWPVEMVVRAAADGWRIGEVPVGYTRRIGRSKVTGTVRGTVRAARDMADVLR